MSSTTSTRARLKRQNTRRRSVNNCCNGDLCTRVPANVFTRVRDSADIEVWANSFNDSLARVQDAVFQVVHLHLPFANRSDHDRRAYSVRLVPARLTFACCRMDISAHHIDQPHILLATSVGVCPQLEAGSRSGIIGVTCSRKRKRFRSRLDLRAAQRSNQTR